MDLKALQTTLREFAAEREWQPFHTPKNLAMALMVEAAELAEIFQWMTPEQSQAARGDLVLQEQVADEVADVLLYLVQIADHTGIDLKRAVGRKLVKNSKKHPPLRPGLPGFRVGTGAAGDTETHVLVDWENVQPKVNAGVLECGIGVTDVRAARAALTAAPRAIAVLDANLSPVDVYGRPIIDMVQRRLSGTAVEECRCRILVSLTDSVAALPLPGALEVVSLSVSLDRVPKFIEEDSASSRLEEAASGDRGAGWLARVWKPAASHLLTRLRELPSDELALVLSVLESAEPDS